MKLNYLYIAILTCIPLLSFSQSKYYASTKAVLISDLNYSRGINLKGSNSNDIETLKISSPFGLTNQDPTWTMAQWGSKYNLKEAELLLDLGDVKNLAEVFVNGEYLGTLWNKTPFCNT